MRLSQVLLTVVLCFTAYETVNAQSDLENIERFIQDVMQEYGVPGLTIAVVKDGEPYLTRGYGVKNMYTEEPVDEHTQFYLASTAKSMTAALLMIALNQSDKYDLDSPVKDILGPDFHLSEYYRTMTVNSRDMLAHRVNIAASEFHWMMAEITDREEIIERFRFWEATTPYRSDNRYSNIMYTAAGVVAAKLLNCPFEECMDTYIFKPLGMMNTTYMHKLTEEQLEKFPTAHYIDFVTGRMDVVDMDVYLSCVEATAPAGGVVSTASDLLKWLQFQARTNFESTDSPILEPELLEITRRPHMINYPNSIENYKPYVPVTLIRDTYGLGWYLGSYREYRMMQHAGAFFGYWANVMVLPDMGAGVYMCVNGPDGYNAGPAMDKITWYIIDTLLGEEPWVNVSYPEYRFENLPDDYAIEKHLMVEAELAKNVKTSVIGRKALVDYAGNYGNYAMGNITVVYENDTLTGTYGATGNFRLFRANDEDPEDHVFIANAQDPLWFLPPVRAIFHVDNTTGIVSGLSVPIFLAEDPPTFIRDLKMASAPEPPTDNCP